MNSEHTLHRELRRLGALAGLALLSSPLVGQVAPPAPPAAVTPPDQPVVLDPFQVNAQNNRGYQAEDIGSASKLALPIDDVPQTVLVYTADFLHDIDAVNLNDIMSYVPGATHNVGPRNQDGFTLRGFNQPLTYLDGFRDGEEWAGGETIQIAQLEVLEGPATNLYGNSRGFGGIINRVSKEPQPNEFNEAEVDSGNFDFFRFTFDSTGPITDDKTWMYRVTAADTFSDSYRDFMDFKRLFISPVVTKKIGSKLTVTLYTEFLRNDTQEDIGIPAVPGPNGTVVVPNVPISRNYAENWEDSLLDKEAIRLLPTYQINEHWTLRGAAIGTFFNNPIYQAEATSVNNTTLALNRDQFKLNRWEDHFDVEADLLGRFDTGPIHHELLMGYEYYHERGVSNVDRGPLASISIYNPVYGAPLLPDSTLYATPASNLWFRDDFVGFYANEQMSMLNDRIRIFGGFRRDLVYYHSDSKIPGGVDVAWPLIFSTTPQFGFEVKPIPQVSVYAQYSSAFVPITASTTPAYQALPPETGHTREAGIKTTLLNTHFGAQLSYFKMEADDLSVRLPAPQQSFFTSGGYLLGEGEQLDITYSDRNWNFIGGYVYEFVDNLSPPAALIQGIFQSNWKFLGKYTFTDGLLDRLSVGLGLDHAPGVGFDNNLGHLNGYTRVDVISSYNFRHNWNFNLDIQNLTNEKYYIAAGSPAFIVVPQPPLTFRLSARFTF